MEKVSKDEFYARLSGVKLTELRAMAAEQGHTLSAASKSDAVDELWLLYNGKLTTASSEPSSSAEASASMGWEGRLIDSRRAQYRRAGYPFTRRWEKLSPAPDAAQLEVLQADPAIQVRLGG